MKNKLRLPFSAIIAITLFSSCFVRVHGRRAHVVDRDRDLIQRSDDGKRTGFMGPKSPISPLEVMKNNTPVLHSTF